MAFSLSSLIGTLGGKGSIYSYYPPLWFYDLCALFFWPLNYLITLYASFPLPSRPDYDMNPAYKAGTAAMTNKATEGELREIKGKLIQRSRQTFDEEQLLQLFDTLEPVSSSSLMKNFKGHVVHTGSLLDAADLIPWALSFFGVRWGKRYRSPYKGDPLLAHIKFPFGLGQLTIPVPIWGNVSQLTMEYRGKSQGTMNYDQQPWRDYFRLLQSTPDGRRIILGVWCCREKIGGWFTLEDFPELNNAVADVHQEGTEKSYQN